MEHNLEQTISLLARTPAALDGLLRDLPPAWTLRNEGGESWSAFDIVGHLIFADRTDWLPRAKMILEHGDTLPFEPFDRQGHVRESEGKTMDQLLHEFARVRSKSLSDLRSLNLKAEDFDRPGKHPALGAVTMAQLLSTWAVHDLNHLHQLSRVLAYQYKEAVGPWAKFLGVTHCDAHGA
jgi:hypothetical protein